MLASVPTFALTKEDEPTSIQNAIDHGRYKLRAVVPDKATIKFMAVEYAEFVGHPVDVIRHVSTWTVDFVKSRNEWTFRSGDSRSWTPEPEVGEMASTALASIASGHMTGPAASAAVLGLLTQLEIELAAKDPWLDRYHPEFFKYYKMKLAKAKETKVRDVMES